MKTAKKNLRQMDYSDRIQYHYDQIKMLEYFQSIEHYFKKIKNTRESYVVELRKQVAKELFEEGHTLSEIGRLINRHHASVIHLLRIKSHKYIEDEVVANYKQWIIDEVYPKSVSQLVTGEYYKEGYGVKVSYKLESIHERFR